MPSCSNSSNIYGNVNISEVTGNGARLMMQHPISGFSGGIMLGSLDVDWNEVRDGVTAGDVVRYDVTPGSVSENKYTKAQADIPEHAEVIGVIESITNGSDPGVNDVVNVVLSGQIKFPSGRFATADHIATPTVGGSSGGNDIYFLSGVTAGGIQNLAPSAVGTIAKPVIQAAADNVFTGHVVNYIGYQIGGSVYVDDPDHDLTGTMATIVDFGSQGSNIKLDTTSQWFPLNQETWLATDKSASYYTNWTYGSACSNVFYDGMYGVEYSAKLDRIPSGIEVGQTWIQKNANGTQYSSWLMKDVNRTTNTVILRGININPVDSRAIGVDHLKKLWRGRISYDILNNDSSNVIRIGFALPRSQQNESILLKDYKGAATVYNKIDVVFVYPDGGIAGAHFAQDITVDSITALRNMTVYGGVGDDIVATDIANILYQHDLDIAEIASATGRTKTNVDITPPT